MVMLRFSHHQAKPLTKHRAQLPLTAMRAFEAAARQGNLRQAAMELHLTPGAVSQQVRALEDRLGVALFERGTGRYVLTPSGQQLLGQLTHCFDAMEFALAEVISLAEPKKLRIKLAPTLAVRWLAPRLVSFFSWNPDIDLEVMTIATSEEVNFDQCDFVVRFGVPPWPDMDSILLFRDELIIVCSPALAASMRGLDDLQHHTLLYSSLRDDGWTTWLQSAGMDPSLSARGVKFNNSAMACEAAISGSGIAVMQWAYVQADLAAGRLVQPFDHHAISDKGYYMTSASHRRGERKIQDFSKWLESIAQS